MNLHLPRKSRLFRFIGFTTYMALAIFVFTWGLQYKLSLYDPPQAVSHQIPQAKLLSKNEQAGARRSPLVIQKKSSTRFSYTVPTTCFSILFIVLSESIKASGRRRHLINVALHLEHALFDIFLVRPPPIFC